jgi:hypothetical protein
MRYYFFVDHHIGVQNSQMNTSTIEIYTEYDDLQTAHQRPEDRQENILDFTRVQPG